MQAMSSVETTGRQTCGEGMDLFGDGTFLLRTLPHRAGEGSHPNALLAGRPPQWGAQIVASMCRCDGDGEAEAAQSALELRGELDYGLIPGDVAGRERLHALAIACARVAANRVFCSMAFDSCRPPLRPAGDPTIEEAFLSALLLVAPGRPAALSLPGEGCRKTFRISVEVITDVRRRPTVVRYLCVKLTLCLCRAFVSVGCLFQNPLEAGMEAADAARWTAAHKAAGTASFKVSCTGLEQQRPTHEWPQIARRVVSRCPLSSLPSRQGWALDRGSSPLRPCCTLRVDGGIQGCRR